MLSIIGLILLWILRIIGIILGLIIFLLLLLLFVPFRYDATGSFDNNINVKVKFSWLLKFINGKFTMDDDGQNTIVRVLFFKVYPSKEKPDKEDKKSKKTKKNKKTKGKKKVDLTTNVKEASTVTQAEDVDYLDASDSANSLELEDLVGKDPTDTSTDNNQLNQESDNEVNEEQTESQEESDTETNEVTGSDKKDKKSKKSKKKKDKKKKDKEPNKNIEQAKELWAFLQVPENEGVLKFITKYIVKIIKWILPKKVYVNMELGLEDPALTGYIAAVTSIVYVATQKNIHIAPNFNEQVVKGDFRIKGRLYLYQLLYYIIRVIIDKRVRRLIKKVRS